MARHTMLVELDLPSFPKLPSDTREKRIKTLSKASDEAKLCAQPLLESCRRIHPDLHITSQDTIFPVLVITTTDPVIRRLKTSPFVKNIGPAYDFQALSESF